MQRKYAKYCHVGLILYRKCRINDRTFSIQAVNPSSICIFAVELVQSLFSWH